VAVFIGATENDGTGTSASGLKPSGVEDGDILFAGVCHGSAGAPSGIPAGWAIADGVATDAMSNAQGRSVSVYWKEASGEGASWAWTVTNDDWAVMVTAYRDVVVDGTPTAQAGTGQTDSIDYPVSANTDPDVLVIYFEYGRWFSLGGSGIVEWDPDPLITIRAAGNNGIGGRFGWACGDYVHEGGIDIPTLTNGWLIGGGGAVAVAGVRTTGDVTIVVATDPAPPGGLTEVDLALMKLPGAELPYSVTIPMLEMGDS
jgi:hypothetical protein